METRTHSKKTGRIPKSLTSRNQKNNMENKFNKEEEAVIAFLSWSNGGSINEITQEMKDALYPTISQLPESSKRMCYRMGGILQVVFKTIDIPDGDGFWLKTEEEQKSHIFSLGKSFVDDMEVNTELQNIYLDFLDTCTELRFGADSTELLQEQMKLIVSKES